MRVLIAVQRIRIVNNPALGTQHVAAIAAIVESIGQVGSGWIHGGFRIVAIRVIADETARSDMRVQETVPVTKAIVVAIGILTLPTPDFAFERSRSNSALVTSAP